MAEAVKVIVRCRPMNQREKNLGCEEIVCMNSGIQCALVNPDSPNDPPKDFTFDGAYFTDSTTEQIYNDVCFDLVENVLEGYNGTVFAYGQTGCGKSFSMQGIVDPATQRGIIPRAFDHIFEAVSVTKDKKFLVHASYLEIYNEQVRDLLSKDAKKQLDLKEHPDKGVYVHGLSLNEVRNVDECQLLMAKGWNNRSVGATLMNADSSRSHSIFTINIEMIAAMDAASQSNNSDHILAAKLNLVDLAGSERQSKTGASGDRLKEATKINLSLSALGNVISALVDGKSKHIPYRDSKLTRLLQDSLGGNTKTLMVACLSPAGDNYDETLSTLRYANRAKNIKNKPKINEDPKDALLRQYQEEIMQLKALLQGKPISAPVATASALISHPNNRNNAADEGGRLEMEKEKIKNQYESQLRQMEQQIADLSQAKNMVEHELSALKEAAGSSKSSQKNKQQPEITSPTDTVHDEGQNGRELNEIVQDVEALQEVVDEDQAFEEFVTQLDDEDDEEGECNRSGSGRLLEVKLDESVASVRKSPELRRKVSRPKSSAPSLISISETEFEAGSPRLIKNSLSNGETRAVTEDNVMSKLSEPEQLSRDHTAGAGDVPRSGQSQNSAEKQPLQGPPSNSKEETSLPAAAAPLTPEQEAAFKRLQELERMFDKKFIQGGEKANNSGLQEKRARRKKHAEETRRKALREAAESENMDTVVQVYDNVMNEIQDKVKTEEKLRKKIQAAEVEIRDLQSEFEDERRDYLETIRSQSKQMQLVEAILEKIQPLIQRDCNYYNVRKIKQDAKFDLETSSWKLPDIQMTKTNLPSLGSSFFNVPGQDKGANVGSFSRLDRSNTNSHAHPHKQDANDHYQHTQKFHDENYHQQQFQNDDVIQSYMKPKRAQRLLEEGAASRHENSHRMMTSQQQSAGLIDNSLYGNGGGGVLSSSTPSSSRNHLSSLIEQSYSTSNLICSPLEMPNPKNVRLEKLDINAERPLSSKNRKKKKEKTFVS